MIEYGSSMVAALACARRLGCTVTRPRRTGELAVRAPDGAWSMRMSARRKDAPRELIARLRTMARRKDI